MSKTQPMGEDDWSAVWAAVYARVFADEFFKRGAGHHPAGTNRAAEIASEAADCAVEAGKLAVGEVER